MTMSLLRSRWAAIGAAVAVSLGAGGIGITQATTSSGEMPIYVPIEPCRLADTRPAFLVGTRATPIGADETYTLSGWGTVGDCALPNGTTGLSLNVTATDPTQATFLTLFPATSTLPTASHLNPTPGQPPTPNAVNVDLDTSGEFSVYNRFGTVHIIIDVVGYFDDHVHTGDDIEDGSLTGDDIDDGSLTGDDVANGSLTNSDTGDEPGIVYEYNTTPTNLPDSPTVDRIVQTSIRVPADGYLVVQVSGYYTVNTAGNDAAYCQFTKGAQRTSLNVLTPSPDPWFPLEDFATSGSLSHFSSHAVIEVSQADNPNFLQFGQLIGVDCLEVLGEVSTDDVSLTVTYYRTKYSPLGIIVI